MWLSSIFPFSATVKLWNSIYHSVIVKYEPYFIISKNSWLLYKLYITQRLIVYENSFILSLGDQCYLNHIITLPSVSWYGLKINGHLMRIWNYIPYSTHWPVLYILIFTIMLFCFELSTSDEEVKLYVPFNIIAWDIGTIFSFIVSFSEDYL